MIIKDISIGTDVEKTSRFETIEFIETDIFLNKVFTNKEIGYCLSKDNPAPHLAVRFSGKESIIKAMAGIGITIDNYQDIEILNDQNGVPKARIRNGIYPNIIIKVSLSHCEDVVITFALVILVDTDE